MNGRIDRADVVIIGGGIIGCSIAYHLARSGVSDVLVLERNALGSGATARSAGLVLHGRADDTLFRMVRRTREAIEELEAELEDDIGFHRVGSLHVTTSAERGAEVRSLDDELCRNGIESATIDSRQAAELVPWLEASSACRISYVAEDGYVDPHRLTAAYAAAARRRGVRFRLGGAAVGLLRDGMRIGGVATDQEAIHADWVVDAAGAWAIGVAGWLPAGVAAAPTRSHYWITAPEPAYSRDHSVVLLPDARAYVRPEVGGLLIGVQESASRTYDARELPNDINAFSLSGSEDWDLLLQHAESLRAMMPSIDRLTFAHHIAGLSMYTPDGKFLLGRLGPLEGFVVASGCCGTGVSASGGIGQAIAGLILERPGEFDLAPFRPDRFGAVDPYASDFRQRCAAARATKSRTPFSAPCSNLSSRV